MTIKKRNPQDATLRNARAAAKRDAATKKRIRRLELSLAVAFSLIRLLASAVTPALGRASAKAMRRRVAGPARRRAGR